MQTAVTIDHNGMQLRGMEHIPEGDKLPAVILFHGFTGNKLEPHRLFLKISRALEEQGFASFRFDFLGSGESDGDFEDMTISKETDEAETIFNYVKTHPKVNEDRIIILGLSMGGLVASLLAGKLQNQVERLILMAPAGTIGISIERMREFTPYIESHDAYDHGGNLVGSAFGDDVKTIDVWKRASAYKGKVLLIHGTKDQAVPYEVSNLYIEKCYGDQATLHTIHDGDHTFNSYYWEKEVIETIIEFVEA
ncbi:alpha/beta hydrolase [Lederbergia sp. NSJ-179]|uniref:alpha/beta hydrolase n=1 Tax=Lederbergia sp. NSJ-179 TaxID=2931402 RepID=UPI001FD2FCE8|nr:alpha/beta hydrolase [Lederbergia sp. NSJ-179]MCJ7842370.1 alpha/beta hydrolase [Lederbergia sp. NSJ-179]